MHVGQLVEEVFRCANIDEEAAGEDEFLAKCRTKIEEIKTAMEEKILEDRGDADPPEGMDEWPEIVIEQKDIRVPDDLL